MNKYFAESELIINEDGSCFHLHLRPEQLADKVILVGDPGRVSLVASHFEEKECEVESREFHAITGTYKGKRITVQSTGIGCDNIDIVVNELDALKNIDFKTRTEKPEHTTLTLVRIGTCGGLQLNCPAGTFVASQKSIGFDGLINFYARRNEICDLDTEKEFKRQVKWNDQIGNPYCVDNNPELLDRIAADDMVRGITIACGGFYGPQGRELRAPLADPELNAKLRLSNITVCVSTTSRWRVRLLPDCRCSSDTRRSPAAWSSPTDVPSVPILDTRVPSTTSSK